MKRFDALIATQKTSSLCQVSFLKKNWKTAKKCSFFMFYFLFFQKWDFAESWGFLRCNHCIKTLHLSYQMTLSDDFHFSSHNGGVRFFRPLVEGVKIQFWHFLKLISSLMHQTTPKTTWGSNVSPMLRKMEELVPPLLVLAVLEINHNEQQFQGHK